MLKLTQFLFFDTPKTDFTVCATILRLATCRKLRHIQRIALAQQQCIVVSFA